MAQQDTSTLGELAETGNIAETLAREFKQPVTLPPCGYADDIARIALPPGWTLAERDDEKYGPTPRRKRGKVVLDGAQSFTDYVTRHGSPMDGTIWCEADFTAGKVAFTAILNDHSPSADGAAWRDHIARYTPEFSEEWKRWTGKHAVPFSQAEFGAFIEENLRDVAAAENMPTGTQMLEMALNFEARQDMRFKSAMRLQNGAVQMTFIQDDDAQTVQQMQLFERFALGLPVFRGGDAYQLLARLRYRVRDGKLAFWYELIRKDKVLEAATQTLIDFIRARTDEHPFFFGEPFAA